MTNYAHLKTSRKDSIEYTMWDVVGEPKLMVRQAGELNKPYFNEKLKRAEQIQRRKLKLSTELIRDNRERDRELFPKYVIVGWKDVKDAEGNIVPFTPEECVAFLRALDDDQFDGIREFCSDGTNFRDSVENGTTAGNSQSA